MPKTLGEHLRRKHVDMGLTNEHDRSVTAVLEA